MKKIITDILSTEEMLENIAWHRKQYRANEVVIKEGDVGHSFFFVEEGRLRVSRKVNLEDAKRIQPGIADITEGSIFGESSLNSCSVRISSVTAVSESVLIEVNSKLLNDFLENHTTFGYLFYKELYTILIKRLNDSNHTLETIMAWGLKAHEIDQYL